MLYRLGLFCARHRWPIIMAWLLAFLLSLLVLPQITSPLKEGFGDMKTESRQALDHLADRFGTSEASLTIVFSSQHLTAAAPQYRLEMESALAPLRQRPDVGDITTFYDGGTPSMVSDQGGTTYAAVSLNATIDEAIAALPDLSTSLGPSQLDVRITGGVAIFSDINRLSERDLLRGELIAIPLVLVALVFVFRGLAAAAVPVAMGAVSVSVALALLFFVAQGLDVSIFALNIASFLGLGVAVDYSLLVVSRFREEFRDHPRDQAVALTLETAGRAILFASLTSILGLASLLLFDFMMLRSLGISGVLVIAVSLLVALTLLPAILAVMGPRINAFPILYREGRGRGHWRRLAHCAMRRPFLVAVPLILLLLAMGIPFLGVNLGSPWADTLPREASSRQGWDLVARDIGPGELSPIVISAQFSADTLTPQDTTRLAGLVQGLERNPRVDRVESLLTPNKPADDIDNEYLRGDTTVVRVYSRFSPVADESREVVRQIRSADLGPGATLLVTGATADLMDSIDIMYDDFPKAVALVLVTVYIALLFLFRSVVLPLKAVVMNLMSIFASYGALVYIFQQGHLEGLLGFSTQGTTEATIPILLFAIIFGLSMDYEIFLLTRVREEYQATGDNALSVARGLEATGPIITSAAMVLVLVATAFATADIIIVKALGVGTAIAIFLDATIVRALLVPSLMQIMGRWNWWAPQWIRGRAPNP